MLLVIARTLPPSVLGLLQITILHLAMRFDVVRVQIGQRFA
jgi:hypothetical protein